MDNDVRVEFDNIKSDIKELKESDKQHTKDIINLKESNIELKIYIKQIFEKIEEVKAMIQTKKEDNENDEKDKDDRMDKFIDIMLETFKDKNKVESEIKKDSVKASNEVKINSNKQKWIIIGSIITSITSILIAIFK